MNRVLVVASHPDDECLGCGGSIVRWVQGGHQVGVYILSSDPKQENSGGRLAAIDIKKALKVLGVKDFLDDSFPDNQFDTVAFLELVETVELAIRHFKPGVIYTHSKHCLNQDHVITYKAVLTATRPPSTVKEIYSFEIPSSTEWNFGESFSPNYFVELSEDDLEAKIKAMKRYATEIRNYPHPRSPEGIKALAQVRGMQAGVKYAEGFQVVRILT